MNYKVTISGVSDSYNDLHIAEKEFANGVNNGKECTLLTDKTALHYNRWGRLDRFNVVDEFPKGCIIWPIGRANFPFEGFIPVVHPHSTESNWIDQERPYYAVKCVSEQAALNMMHLNCYGGKITRENFSKFNR